VTVRCVLVDDNEEFIASATRLLESQGFEIVGHATSADAALRLIDDVTPEVALVDIELGEDDGVALTHVIRTRAPATRIVLISAYGRDDLNELIVDSSAVGFVHKSQLGVDAIEDVLRS
jgi:two-component system, NarL family, nitrate/nitrite response regulator NarL